MTEIVYILTNEAMPGMVKIGRTTNDLAGRIRALFGTGVPLPFELFFACEVNDGTFVEAQLHDAFDDHRVSQRREFFRIAPERIQSALRLASLREIRLGDEVFEIPQDKEDVAAAKRRGRFKLSMIGIKPGTELILARDPSIKCTTLDDVNQVEFRGRQTSLSDAAIQAYASLGLASGAVSGPWAWTVDGKRLDDMRRELDEMVS
ncbi:MAG: GIY-YIG nuclease family protein [Hyphomicrobiaceae bacterium]|nr:GIY-YIG nuclease family protein [Hyphomicrobiaceae bacterium]